MRETRWDHMFPDQLEAAFEACPVVYFSYGLCEPHGPHCSLGLDAIKAHAICVRAAQAHGGIVAPPDYWHIHEVGGYAVWAQKHAGEARPWLTAVPPWIHFKNVLYHVRAADALGFQAAILVTGHYGPNWHDLKRLLAIVQPHFAMRLCGIPDFEANQPGFGETGESSDHAGKVETSQLWALAPSCVDVSRFPPADATGPQFAMGATAREANRQIGERMVDDQVRWLGRKAEELLLEFGHVSSGERRAVTFAEVEALWRDEVEPVLHEFASMQELFEGQREGPPANSRWRLNWQIQGGQC